MAVPMPRDGSDDPPGGVAHGPLEGFAWMLADIAGDAAAIAARGRGAALEVGSGRIAELAADLEALGAECRARSDAMRLGGRRLALDGAQSAVPLAERTTAAALRLADALVRLN